MKGMLFLNTRRTTQRHRRRATTRFYVIAAVAVIAIAAIAVVLCLTLFNREPAADPATTSASPAPAIVDEMPAADVTPAPADIPAEDASAANAISSDSLSAMLGSEEGELAALPEEKRVKVTDLSINPDLPSEWKNILLLGTDERNLEEGSRTDAMMICSINSQTGEVKLTSILRDMAVEFPELGGDVNTYRINAANYFGGPELTMKRLNECFNLNIEDYVMVNFYGFQDIAHLLGGIDIDITEAEMHAINDMVVEVHKAAVKAGIDDSNIPGVELKEYGKNVHLDGRQTLAYSRIRKLDSDISRAERQRIVMAGLMEKVKGKSAMELTTLAVSLSEYVKMNLSVDEILSIAVTALSKELTVETAYFPATGTYVSETRNGESMLYDCNWAENAAQLHAFIYE